ncbi:MAG: NAD-dependent epimerase/dehydratase family protein [Deltaproteobacteria bacterium]|nr:NAD-dependent epimerase/dehydratase family protein [Deltaproteobacteria bacterium]
MDQMESSGKILITGAAGFVGAALCRHLSAQGLPVRAVVRRNGSLLPAWAAADVDEIVTVSGQAGIKEWIALLDGVESIVHLAARAHQNGRGAFSDDDFFRSNLDMSVALARAAASTGVRRLIFLSTVKVNGEGSWHADWRPYRAYDQPRPEGPYAVSKWRAEQELERICGAGNNIDLTVIRAPLVYGPGVKSNFASLLAWLGHGFPVVVPRPANRRSLIYLDNLIDLIEFSLVREEMVGKIVLASDGEDYSLAQIIDYLTQGSGRRPHILTLPSAFIRMGAKMIRCEAVGKKIFGSLRIDVNSLKELGWNAPISGEIGFDETAAWGRKTRRLGKFYDAIP